MSLWYHCKNVKTGMSYINERNNLKKNVKMSLWYLCKNVKMGMSQINKRNNLKKKCKYVIMVSLQKCHYGYVID